VAQIKRKIVVPVVILAVLGVALWAGLSLMRPGGREKSATGKAGAVPGGSGTVVAAANKEDAPPEAADKDAKAGDKEDKSGKKDEKPPVPVSVAPIEVGAVSSYITATANLIAESEVKIFAEAEGRVAALNVEEGQRAPAGSVLAALVRDDAEIDLTKAEMRAANAEQVYKRAQESVDQRLISREQFDKAGLDNDIAKQELREARWRLEKTSIKAPIAGRVTERTVKLGQHVHPGDVLFTIANFDPLVAKIYLAEKDIYGLREGREVRITLKANEDTRFHGRIRQISPVVDVATGTVKVTVEAVAPPGDVRPGSFVTVEIVRTTHANARLVPREAVIRELQDAYVFVAVGGVAKKRPVELGLEEGSRIEAVQGLEPGEQVIVAGQGGLKDGAAVKVIVAPQASDLGRPDDRVRTQRG